MYWVYPVSKSIHDSISSSGASNIQIWIPKLDEWSDEAGTDYEAKEETSNESEADKEETITEDEDEDVSDEKEVQDGNANEEEVKAEGGGGMPKMPLKMPNPAKMNDQEKWCGNILALGNFLVAMLDCYSD